MTLAKPVTPETQFNCSEPDCENKATHFRVYKWRKVPLCGKHLNKRGGKRCTIEEGLAVKQTQTAKQSQVSPRHPD